MSRLKNAFVSNITDEFDESRLVGLFVGGVMRQEEYFNKHNEIKTSAKLNYLCGTERIKNKEFTIPEPLTMDKLIKKQDDKLLNKATNNDDEIPF
jgi:hypothetical protein